MTFVHTNQPQHRRGRNAPGRAIRLWLALLWLSIGVGICISLLNMLSLLPCGSQCTQDSTTPVAASMRVPGDLRAQTPQPSMPEAPVPHHHHTPPRVAFESVLVQMGLLSTLLLLIGALFRSARHGALRLTSAPPTPPPRAA